PYAITEPHRQDVNPRKHPRIEGPNIEIGHLRDLWQRGARIETIGAHDEGEVAVDAPEGGILWMYDEGPHHSHCHLHHLVGMGVVHERATAIEHELIDEGLVHGDVRLG